jgi:hypothetical protein
MGGGGGGPGRIGNIDSLIGKAKDELRAGEQAGRRNVFLSFAYEDISLVNLLRGQARNENMPLEFNDWSVSEPINSDRASYIKEKISDRIAQSSVTVIVLSESSRVSQWVEWEIGESLRQGKHVIGMYPSTTRPSGLPAAFAKHGLKAVPWSDLPAEIERLP